MKHLIVDGMNFFIRAFSANPSMDVNGEHVGGVIGFLMGLNKLIRENVPDRVIVVWDGEGGSVRRRAMFKDYKAGRKPRFNREYDYGDDPEKQVTSLRDQLITVSRYLDMLPVTTIKVKGLEADDVIAYLVNFSIAHDEDKIIVSSDKDFYQLLDEHTVMYTPTQKKYIATRDVIEKFCILPENFVFMKAICGDGSDNISGIKGIGPKTFTKLFPFVLDKQITIEEIFDHSEKNRNKKNKYETILESRELITGNIKLMQLSSPLMSPIGAATIRLAFEKEASFMPIQMRMVLTNDGMQIKAADFFSVFKGLMLRTNKVRHGG